MDRQTNMAFRALGWVVITLPYVVFAADKPEEVFDVETLKRRGLDPRLAAYFRKAPRFSAGTQSVQLIVNGDRRGLAYANFDDLGQLCLDASLQVQANLVMPSGPAPTAPGPADHCNAFLAAYPTSQITLSPNRNEVNLLVPTAALGPITKQQTIVNHLSGGTAGLLNYDVLVQRSEYGSTRNQYQSANTELGFNASDWIMRSRQNYVQQGNVNTFNYLYSYAQRSFTDWKTTMQVGEIDLGASLFGGAPITGVQFVPEAALQRQESSGARIEGIARSQARVEVRQGGASLYSTVVPAGPFAFNDVQLLNNNTDVEVVITESNGSVERLRIPAASLDIGAQGSPPGLSFGLGKIRNNGGNQDDPWVASLDGGMALGSASIVSASGITTHKYLALGTGVDTNWQRSIGMSAQTRWSQDRNEGVNGVQGNLGLNAQVSALSLGGSFSATLRSPGYRVLFDSLSPTAAVIDQRYRSEFSTGLNWRNSILGGFSINHSRATSFSGTSSRRVGASWGASIYSASLSVNAERNLDTTGNTPKSSYYVSLSVPLGERRRVSSSFSSSGDQQRSQVSLNEQVNDALNYSLSTNYESKSHQQDFSGSVGGTSRYTQANLNYSRSGESSTNTSLQLQGGVAAHAQGVTLSPYPIRDTFGIAKVGDVSGVRLNTPAGPVWTDFWGQAVLPQLTPYGVNRVDVDARTLPKDFDIVKGVSEFSPARGAIKHLDFAGQQTRRILLTVDPKGPQLPKGSSVLDGNGLFLTVVLDQQQIYINNLPEAMPMTVLGADGTCTLNFTVPATPQTDQLFEELPATCQPAKLP